LAMSSVYPSCALGTCGHGDMTLKMGARAQNAQQTILRQAERSDLIRPGSRGRCRRLS